MDLKIPTPSNFSFRRTVASHGWYQLPPFALDTGKWELSRVIDVGQKPPVTIFLAERKTHIRVTASRPLTKSEATIVLRDQDLDLAFIRPTSKPAAALTAVNLADAARPAILDDVVVLSRLGRVGGWAPAAVLYSVGAIIEKPRTFFVLNGQPGTGTPAFLANGKIVGVLTIRQVDPGRMSMFGLMQGSEGAGVIPVILPAADVLEIAKQAAEGR